MGLSTKKSKTTTNQQTTATQTPTNPGFVTDSVSGLSGRINDTFAGLDPKSLVPDADPLQVQAGQGAAGLTTSPNYGNASDILSRVAGAGPQSLSRVSIADQIPGFLNPYLKDVVDTSLADYDYGAGQQEAQSDLDLAGDTTFGGSGGAIGQALLRDRLASGRGTLSAGLRSDAYDKASGLASTQAGLDSSTNLSNASLMEQALARQGAAAGGLADIAGAQGDQERANVGTQSAIGEMLRLIAGQKAGAPITALNANADLLSKLPFDLFKGINATGSLSGTSTSKESGAGLGDWLNFFAANASAAAKGAGGG